MPNLTENVILCNAEGDWKYWRALVMSTIPTFGSKNRRSVVVLYCDLFPLSVFVESPSKNIKLK